MTGYRKLKKHLIFISVLLYASCAASGLGDLATHNNAEIRGINHTEYQRLMSLMILGGDQATNELALVRTALGTAGGSLASTHLTSIMSMLKQNPQNANLHTIATDLTTLLGVSNQETVLEFLTQKMNAIQGNAANLQAALNALNTIIGP